MPSFLTRRFLIGALAAGLAVAAGVLSTPKRETRSAIAAGAVKIDFRKAVLAAHRGEAPVDLKIRSLQERARLRPDDANAMVALGHSYLSKARLAHDPGFYRLAELCAHAAEKAAPAFPDALLLRGHCRAAMHQFKEAEAIGRQLTESREHFLDWGLLGDARMEQGDLAGAIDAYQKMGDLKPCLPVYTRVAHVRWLGGDLAGAIEAMEEAIQSGNPRDAEALAWATNRLARYRWQEGNAAAASSLVDRALELVPGYAAALLTRGQMQLGKDQAVEAEATLRRAAENNPLPEYLWAWIEALRAAEQPGLGGAEALLDRIGAAEDQRTYSIYLATSNREPLRALELARAELATRQDIFTHDAIAWAQRAAGDMRGAQENIRLALREGTRDARLAFHAGVILRESGDFASAEEHLSQARALQHLLLPSERRLLHAQPPAAAQSR